MFTAINDKLVIANAMSTFHSKTCIRFVARSTQADYISIENKDGWEQTYNISRTLFYNTTSNWYFLTSLISLLSGAILLLVELVANRWSPSTGKAVCITALFSMSSIMPWASTTSKPGAIVTSTSRSTGRTCLLIWPTTSRNKTPTTKTLHMTTAPSCTMEEQPSPSSLGWKPSLPFLMGRWKSDRGRECPTPTSWGSTSFMNAED